MSEHQESTQDALEEAIAAFQRMSVPDAPPDTGILARLDKERADEARPVAVRSSAKRSGFLVRLLISSAAAVLVIGAVGWLLLHGTASPALADVVKATARHKLVRYRQEEITDTKEQAGAVVRSTVYADFTAPRLYSKSPVLLSVHDGKHHLRTDSRRKTATLDFAPKGYKWLLCCLEEFQRKAGVTREKRELDGQRAVKYRHVEGKQTITLWVDAKTKLPLRMEQESINPSPGITRSTLIWTDFAWDPELPPGVGSLDELFSTRPPPGYTLDDRTRSRKP